MNSEAEACCIKTANCQREINTNSSNYRIISRTVIMSVAVASMLQNVTCTSNGKKLGCIFSDGIICCRHSHTVSYRKTGNIKNLKQNKNNMGQ